MTAGVQKTSVLGVNVQHCRYESVLGQITDLAVEQKGGLAAFCNVHMVMTAYRDPVFRRKINEFNIVAPDGQPVLWAINLLGNGGLTDRVRGFELMPLLCERAASLGLKVFLYGSYKDTVTRLRDRLLERFETLQIVGIQPSRFRPSTEQEDRQDIDTINSSGAQIIFVGMGCPLQENWAYDHRHSTRGVLVCVGGAFDFHSGEVSEAPPWMQKRGLEWLFRLSQEPRRLWRRYLLNNPAYLTLLLLQWAGLKEFPQRPATP